IFGCLLIEHQTHDINGIAIDRIDNGKKKRATGIMLPLLQTLNLRMIHLQLSSEYGPPGIVLFAQHAQVCSYCFHAHTSEYIRKNAVDNTANMRYDNRIFVDTSVRSA